VSLKGITEITVTGSGFSEETQIILGSTRATDITIEGDDTIRFLAPASTTTGESLDLQVFNDSGFALAEDSITYNAQPVFDSFTPRILRLAGGDAITITGSNFEENSTGTPVVQIGGVAATDVVIVDDQTITAVSPPQAAADVAVLLDVVIETDNGDMAAEEAGLALGKGLFFGTSRGDSPTGLYFFDPSTQRIVLALPLKSSVARFVRDPSGQIQVRFGNQGEAALGSTVFGSIDLSEGTASPVVVFKREGSTNSVRTRGVTNLAAAVFASSNNGDLGRLDPVTEEFINIVAMPGQNRSNCLVPGPTPGTIISVGEFDEPMRLIDPQVATVTDLATLSGDILPGSEVRCHGGTVQDGVFFAIQYDRGSRVTTLVSINPQSGVVTFVAELPEAASGLLATEDGR
jgi:hypothetical protein